MLFQQQADILVLAGGGVTGEEPKINVTGIVLKAVDEDTLAVSTSPCV